MVIRDSTEDDSSAVKLETFLGEWTDSLNNQVNVEWAKGQGSRGELDVWLTTKAKKCIQLSVKSRGQGRFHCGHYSLDTRESRADHIVWVDNKVQNKTSIWKRPDSSWGNGGGDRDWGSRGNKSHEWKQNGDWKNDGSNWKQDSDWKQGGNTWKSDNHQDKWKDWKQDDKAGGSNWSDKDRDSWQPEEKKDDWKEWKQENWKQNDVAVADPLNGVSPKMVPPAMAPTMASHPPTMVPPATSGSTPSDPPKSKSSPTTLVPPGISPTTLLDPPKSMPSPPSMVPHLMPPPALSSSVVASHAPIIIPPAIAKKMPVPGKAIGQPRVVLPPGQDSSTSSLTPEASPDLWPQTAFAGDGQPRVVLPPDQNSSAADLSTTSSKASGAPPQTATLSEKANPLDEFFEERPVARKDLEAPSACNPDSLSSSKQSKEAAQLASLLASAGSYSPVATSAPAVGGYPAPQIQHAPGIAPSAGASTPANGQPELAATAHPPPPPPPPQPHHMQNPIPGGAWPGSSPTLAPPPSAASASSPASLEPPNHPAYPMYPQYGAYPGYPGYHAGPHMAYHDFPHHPHGGWPSYPQATPHHEKSYPRRERSSPSEASADNHSIGNLVCDGGRIICDGGELLSGAGSLIVDGGNIVVDGGEFVTSARPADDDDIPDHIICDGGNIISQSSVAQVPQSSSEPNAEPTGPLGQTGKTGVSETDYADANLPKISEVTLDQIYVQQTAAPSSGETRPELLRPQHEAPSDTKGEREHKKKRKRDAASGDEPNRKHKHKTSTKGDNAEESVKKADRGKKRRQCDDSAEDAKPAKKSSREKAEKKTERDRKRRKDNGSS